MTGYVYFIQINGMQPIKIGYTTDPKGTDRFDSAKTYAPFGVTYVANIPSSNAAKLEKELHQRFADKRLNGEWFDISQAQAYKIAMKYGGNAGAPTLDVELFGKIKNNLSFNIDNKSKNEITYMPINIKEWYQELPIKFTRRIFTEKTHFENLKKYNIGNPNSGKLCRLLADRNLFLKEPIKGGHYIKTNNNDRPTI